MQRVVARGRVEVFIESVTVKASARRACEVNDGLARIFMSSELRRFGKRLHLNGNPEMDFDSERPEIFQVVEEEHDLRAAFALGQKALSRALKALERSACARATA